MYKSSAVVLLEKEIGKIETYHQFQEVYRLVVDNYTNNEVDQDEYFDLIEQLDELYDSFYMD